MDFFYRLGGLSFILILAFFVVLALILRIILVPIIERGTFGGFESLFQEYDVYLVQDSSGVKVQLRDKEHKVNDKERHE